LQKLRRINVVEVNHWAKVANKKQQLLMYKTAVYTLANGVITHKKTANIKKCDIAQQYIDTLTMSCCVISFLIFAVFDV